MAMNRRLWLAGAVGAAAGTAVGAGGMLVAFPFLFPPPAANDAAPVAVATGGTTARGWQWQFDREAPGRDPIHWANGSGRILRADTGWVLRLEPDFEAGPGPNYWLYLNTRAVGEEPDFNADAGRLRLAALRSFKGAQNYPLPPDLDPSRFHTLTIWCESFSVYIGSGALKAASG